MSGCQVEKFNFLPEILRRVRSLKWCRGLRFFQETIWDPTRGPRSLYIFIYFYFRTQNYIKFSSSFYVPSYGMHAYRPFCILKDIIYVVSRDRIDQCRRESYLRPYIESYRIIEYLFSCFWNKLLHDSIWYWLTHFMSQFQVLLIASPYWIAYFLSQWNMPAS